MVSAGTVVVLAAGEGKRMRSPLPKVLHSICGRPMLGYVLDQARSMDPERILLVVGHQGERVREWVAEAEPDLMQGCLRFVTQAEQKGTGHALQVCMEELSAAPGPVLVLYGDMPLLRAESLAALCEARGEGAASILTARVETPRGFGRILRSGAEGAFAGIVEERDASEEQRAIREVNVGLYCFEREALLERLPGLGNDNAQGEYYLTDVLGGIVAGGHAVSVVTLENEREAIGINDLDQLSEARAVLQRRILRRHLAAGVFIEDPATTFVDHGVEIGAGTRLLPCSALRVGVRVGADCEIGPFAHLRGETVLGDGSVVGNFTEAKNATLGPGSKAKHLSYLGDVQVGARANIGAGTIVANYDGTTKHRTEIGARASIGSGSVLIAPTKIGEGALTGGGAVVTSGSEVPAGQTWVGVPARPLPERTPEQTDDSKA